MTWWCRKYIGTVTGVTKYMRGSHHVCTELVTWTLTEGLFGRRAKMRGSKVRGLSHAAQEKQAQVMAWLAGGPLPKLDEDTKVRPPARVLKMIPGGKE